MKKIYLAYFVVVLTILGLVLFRKEIFMPGKPQSLIIAIAGPWKSIHPGLQHTAYADLVLSNQFDSLVGIDKTGGVLPLGAKSWKVSRDFKIFEFDIDITKRFSDGSRLTAMDYKRSWEEALKLDPLSVNNSLRDVVYLIEGFESFEEKNQISGIQVVGDDKLIVRFKAPFRMALEHLSGNRFSAYKKIDGIFFGTGKYVIFEKNENTLEMVPNIYCKGYDLLIPLKVISIDAMAVEDMLKHKKVDVVHYLFGTVVTEEIKKLDDYKIVSGPETTHLTLSLNGTKGRLFENPKFRKAFQYLIWNRMRESIRRRFDQDYFSLDSQVFLPFQAGRLDSVEVEQYIDEGKKSLDDLKSETHRQPLKVITNNNRAWLIELLSKEGLQISKESKVTEVSDFVKYAYRDFDYDIFNRGFSVVHGDPDGLYHALNRNGALFSPPTYRKEVSEKIEEGRQIMNQNDLNDVYRKVNVAILEQVPFVHIGFAKVVSIYDKDKIYIDNGAIRRNEGHLDIYKLK